MNKAMQKKFKKFLGNSYISKKGQMGGINQLVPWIFGIFIIGLIAAVFLVVLSKFGAISSVTAEANATINALITAIGELADWFSILILLGVIIVVISAIFVVYYFAGGMGGRRR